MRQTLNVSWLDTVTLPEFLAMVEAVPTFQHGIQVPEREDRDNISLPLFNKAFDELCIRLGRIPSQEQYGYYYASVAFDTILREGLDTESVMARAQRNVFSFITEYGIYILLRDAGIDGLFDRGWDLRGVDFLLSHGASQAGLLCMANTTRALDKSKLKDKLRRKGIDFPTFCVMPTPDCTHMYNGIRLFTNLDDLRRACDPN